MKKIFLLIGLTLAYGICADLYAQTGTPAGAGDRNLEDRNIKGRAVELERIRRDGDNKNPETRFAEIKDDFEKMQAVNADLQSMAASAEANRKSVSKAAAEIKKRAVRLKSNLFPETKNKKDSKDKAKPDDSAPSQDLKNLTDRLNTTVSELTHNPIFSNPKFTEADSAQAADDLEKIISFSSAILKRSEKSR